MSSLLFEWSDGTPFSPITMVACVQKGILNIMSMLSHVMVWHGSQSLTDPNSHTIELDILVSLFTHERWILMNHT